MCSLGLNDLILTSAPSSPHIFLVISSGQRISSSSLTVGMPENTRCYRHREQMSFFPIEFSFPQELCSFSLPPCLFYPFIHPSIHTHIHPPSHPSIHPYTHPFIHLCVCTDTYICVNIEFFFLSQLKVNYIWCFPFK